MTHRIAVLIALTAAACGGGGSEGASKETSAAPAASAAALGAATITGTVTFKGPAPANPAIDMSEEPACKNKYTAAPRDPVVAGDLGKLANVFVYVKTGLPEGAAVPPTTAAAPLQQEGCLYHPRVIGVMVNQPIKIGNSDPVLHNIKALPKTNRGFNISQPTAGMFSEKTFTAAENAIPLECNVHGWMHAWVFVMPHPYFAVSGHDGSFSITGLPAGTYTVEAWHQTLGTRLLTVTVPATGSATATVAY